MRCEQLRDLIPLHLLDLLESEERVEVRAHLEGGCPRCAAELAAGREVLDLLPYALPPGDPSPMAKARLMAAARREGDGARRGAPWSVAAAAVAAAAVVAALLAGQVTGRRWAAVAGDLRAQIDRQTEEMAGLREQVRRAQEAIILVSSPGVLVADLAGQPPLPQAAARVFWDRQRSAWQLYAANLPPPAPGKTYQLWLITATSKISAGTFERAAAGEARGSVRVPPDAGLVVAAAITDEPAGGSPQPTGSILLLGKI
jgi:anti-sigma-K factor RskA